MIIPHYYEDPHTLHVGTMPNRAYYIPASRHSDALVEHRETSDRFQLLNGSWKFRYYASIYDLQDAFYEVGYDASAFDSIPVPSVWQNHGYDHHQYTNIRYPFPADPPYVPKENPCGAYLYDFTYQKDAAAPRAFLNFEGVASCFYVWLNGQFVGYSQVAHSTSEFDVTKFLQDGTNHLAVLVLKWCDGSYMEDQDMFRMNGIFRDVYLLHRPEQCIEDYFITTDIHGSTAGVAVRLRYYDSAVATRITLYDAAGTMVGSVTPVEAPDDVAFPYHAEITIVDPTLWNAEQPYLYILVLDTPNETITDRVGIREVHVANNQIYVNGQSIKFHGVNRHESDPVTGYAVGFEQTKKDLLMIKKHNFNAIRTSHYPDVPYFYQLCDQYGFFVIDEADNESHGASEYYCEGNESWPNHVENWNKPIADNPEFTEATVDRTRLCVERDKNRPCVIIWSMGNESAYGCTFEEALAWTKSFDPRRLTHYESAQYRSKNRKYDFSNIDMFSNMYPSLESIQEYLDNEPDKPYIMCEYSHCMGNGPGDLEDYFQFIQSHDGLVGGFLWEWCDHAIYRGKAANGKAMYAYGGDNGETIHDGNFCMDGLVYPDRRPHTGLLEFKNIHRPARLANYDGANGILTLHNYLDFTDIRDYLTMSYEVTCDGQVVISGNIDVPSVAPHGDGTVSLGLITEMQNFMHNLSTINGSDNSGSSTAADCSSIAERFSDKACIKDMIPHRAFLRVIYKAAVGSAFIKEGDVLGFDEVELDSPKQNTDEILDKTSALGKAQTMDKAQNTASAHLHISESDTEFVINGSNFKYTFDRNTGNFAGVAVDGQELLAAPCDKTIWRAPTDNDRNIKNEWLRAHYDMISERTYETGCIIKDGCAVISCTSSLSAPTVQPVLRINAEWIITPEGTIKSKMHVKKNAEFPTLPRFGVRMILREDMRNVNYIGMGPYESYIDKHHASWHGSFSASIDEMHENYIMPQENGSHFDCSLVQVSAPGASDESDRNSSDKNNFVNGSSYQSICNAQTAETIAATTAHSITVTSAVPFSMNASPYTAEELTKAAHNYELPESGKSVLCIDYRQNGIGSNSCGPELDEKYRFDEDEWEFGFTMHVK